MALNENDAVKLAQTIAAQFAEIGQVEAVALGGSLAAGRADALSDIDLYVFVKGEIPVETRAALIEPRASHLQLDNRFWELEDYWIEKGSGIKVEAIYRDPDWMTNYLHNLFEENRAEGFSTALWHSIVVSQNLFDRDGWFADLQKTANAPYPDALAEKLIGDNFPKLRGSMAALPNQIKVSVRREDWRNVLHDIHVLLDTYFTVLFALNRVPHPGGKRQLAYAETLDLTPENMAEDVNGLAVGFEQNTVVKVNKFVDRLETLLSEQGQLPNA